MNANSAKLLCAVLASHGRPNRDPYSLIAVSSFSTLSKSHFTYRAKPSSKIMSSQLSGKLPVVSG
jgi:hypothetical protein